MDDRAVALGVPNERYGLDLERLHTLAKAATPGPWKADGLSSSIWATHPEKGRWQVLDIRGWGFLTGKGHSALGLSNDEALDIQKANAEFAEAVNPETILNLLWLIGDQYDNIACLKTGWQATAEECERVRDRAIVGEYNWTPDELARAIAERTEECAKLVEPDGPYTHREEFDAADDQYNRAAHETRVRYAAKIRALIAETSEPKVVEHG